MSTVLVFGNGLRSLGELSGESYEEVEKDHETLCCVFPQDQTKEEDFEDQQRSL